MNIEHSGRAHVKLNFFNVAGEQSPQIQRVSRPAASLEMGTVFSSIEVEGQEPRGGSSSRVGDASIADRAKTGSPPLAISVIITNYNYEQFSDAIESVLKRTRKADEIIVLDDGSTDR